MKDIKNIIYKKVISTRDINTYFPCIKCCFCGKCSVNQERLLEYIEANFVESTPKNLSYYYEYTQQPVEIIKMNFE